MVWNVTKEKITTRMAAVDEDIWPQPSVYGTSKQIKADGLAFQDLYFESKLLWYKVVIFYITIYHYCTTFGGCAGLAEEVTLYMISSAEVNLKKLSKSLMGKDGYNNCQGFTCDHGKTSIIPSRFSLNYGYKKI
jgi:hypothetical protein